MPFIHILSVVDPLSKSGQRLASMLKVLADFVPMRLDMTLNPVNQIESLPLKSFYHFVFPRPDDINMYVSSPYLPFTSVV